MTTPAINAISFPPHSHTLIIVLFYYFRSETKIAPVTTPATNSIESTPFFKFSKNFHLLIYLQYLIEKPSVNACNANSPNAHQIPPFSLIVLS